MTRRSRLRRIRGTLRTITVNEILHAIRRLQKPHCYFGGNGGAVLSTPMTASLNAGVKDTPSPPLIVSSPFQSVQQPPASRRIRAAAAVSHGFRLASQNPSMRPAATQHRSMADDSSLSRLTADLPPAALPFGCVDDFIQRRKAADTRDHATIQLDAN